MNKKIYVYHDDGCSDTRTLIRWLSRHFPKAIIEKKSAEDIRAGALQQNPPLAFFIGGGQSHKYRDKLRGTGKRAIRNYINDGGMYYGICAGAYYAASEVDYREEGTYFRITRRSKEDSGQLGVFNGKAIGVVHDFNGNGDYRHSAKVKFNKETAHIYYFRGPYFHPFNKEDKIIARFDGITRHPAAVKTRFGGGVVNLLAVHPEQDAKDLQKIGLEATQNSIDAFTKYVLGDLFEVMKPRLITQLSNLKSPKNKPV